MHFTRPRRCPGRYDRVTAVAAAVENADAAGRADGARMPSPQVYAFYFHGPAYQVVASAWRSTTSSVAALADPLPDNHRPAGCPLPTAPRLVELCFQTAGLWQAGLEGRLALPAHVGSARVLRDPATADGAAACHGRAKARPAGSTAGVVDAAGQVIVRLDGYRTIPLPTPIAAAVAAVLRAVFGDRPEPAA